MGELEQSALKACTAFEPEKDPSAKTLRAHQHSVVLTTRPSFRVTKASAVKLHEQTPFCQSVARYMSELRTIFENDFLPEQF